VREFVDYFLDVRPLVDQGFSPVPIRNFMPTKTISLLGLVLVLLLAALDSQALTLGRMRGVALIGQSLDVSFQVQTDPEESASALCFEAEVFHADTRQDPARVQLILEPTQSPQTVNVRIQSSAAVDEPVVTVYLRAGCIQKTTRRYVMLADVLSEPVAQPLARAQQLPLVVPETAPVTTSAATPAVGAANPTGGGAATGRGAATNAAAAAANPSAKPAAVAEAPSKPAPAKTAAPTAAGTGAAEKLVAARVAGQSRLKLDPLEVLSERVATLESSTAPAGKAAREARDTQSLQSLEASVKNLLAVATRNESNLAELRLRVERAESDRYANPLVYVLAGLLLVALAGITYLLARRGGSSAGGGNWWSGAHASQNTAGAGPLPASHAARRSGFSPMSSPAPLSRPDSLPAAEPAHYQTQRSGPPSKPAPITQVDVSLVELSESTFDRLMQSGNTHSAVRKSRPTEPGGPGAEPASRLINSEVLFDVRQQAEFFVSLGQTDQAVRILENRIGESGESSPLAYLDLLKIFHSLGLKADFRQVREDFNLLFNARVPEFAAFTNEGRDLESYPEIVAGLVAVWGKPEILPSVESHLFRDQWTSDRELLDLAAFRDLLLLHAVAQSAALLPDQLLVPAASTLARSPFSSASKPVVQTAASQITLLAARSGNGLALPELPSLGEVDIDLSDLGFELPLSHQLPTIASAPVPVQAAKTNPGNLIDFDLPPLPLEGDKAGPRH
jgi:hypothetical protein